MRRKISHELGEFCFNTDLRSEPTWFVYGTLVVLAKALRSRSFSSISLWMKAPRKLGAPLVDENELALSLTTVATFVIVKLIVNRAEGPGRNDNLISIL